MKGKDMKKLYIEAPCFGFGPISTSLSLANNLKSKYDITFITYGEALSFLKKSADFCYLEIDTRYEENFKDILALVDLEAAFISNTNIEFSTFLIDNNLNVLIVDTLYWMWNNVPERYAKHPFFIAQAYYGDNIANLPNQKICKPIINYTLWNDEVYVKDDTVLISFGGMAEPGDHTYFYEYAKWMVKRIADSIPNKIIDIFVVGGLFSTETEFYGEKVIHFLGALNPLDYSVLVKKCKYLFISPGLTSIYELLMSKRAFCLLPGLNVSQVYQVYHYKNKCPEAYGILWPDVEELVNRFDILSELEGISFLEHYLVDVLSKESVDFKGPIIRYFSNLEVETDKLNDSLYKQIFNHCDIEELASYFLKRMVDK